MRNESFNPDFPFRTRQQLKCCIAIDPILAPGNFVAEFTLTITNITLIGYYLHYVNSSPENNTVSFLSISAIFGKQEANSITQPLSRFWAKTLKCCLQDDFCLPKAFGLIMLESQEGI